MKEQMKELSEKAKNYMAGRLASDYTCPHEIGLPNWYDTCAGVACTDCWKKALRYLRVDEDID